MEKTYMQLKNMLYNDRRHFADFLRNAVHHGFNVDYTPTNNDLTLLQIIYDKKFPKSNRRSCEKYAIPQTLIELGADVNKPDQAGRNLLKQALNVMANLQIVKMILKRTKDINEIHNTTFGQVTAFGVAAVYFVANTNAKEYAYYYKAIRILLGANANPYRDNAWENLYDEWSAHTKRNKAIIKNLITLEKLRPDTSGSKVSTYEYEL